MVIWLLKLEGFLLNAPSSSFFIFEISAFVFVLILTTKTLLFDPTTMR